MTNTVKNSTPNARVIIAVLDGVGAGELPDAAQYGDVGSNTLSHTAQAVGRLNLPYMGEMGLGCITEIEGVPPVKHPIAHWGKMTEASPGKDTITGHWEMAGIVLPRPFPTYPNGFPPDIIAAFEAAVGTKSLGNRPASGTVIIEELGAEHIATGYPIVYTSADSVFQIAMHEEILPITRQYEICEQARAILGGEHEVGRVICRPFLGDRRKNDTAALPALKPLAPGAFVRTENRKDFPVTPPPTVLDDLVNEGFSVHAIGKIYEIFNGRGISTYDHTTNNPAHIAALQTAVESNDSALIFANLEDFDMLYGHRNNPQGMAQALEHWDAALANLLPALRPNDIFLVTADHGNDPTTASTDHSREYPFLLCYTPNNRKGSALGIRATYADIAATIREAFALPSGAHGQSFLSALNF